MHTVIFAVAALVGVAISFGFTKLLTGNASYTELLLPWTFFAGVAAALSSSILLQRFGWWPRCDSTVKTGVARGVLVVGCAPSLFGFYFVASIEFDSLLDMRVGTLRVSHIFPALHT